MKHSYWFKIYLGASNQNALNVQNIILGMLEILYKGWVIIWSFFAYFQVKALFHFSPAYFAIFGGYFYFDLIFLFICAFPFFVFSDKNAMTGGRIHLRVKEPFQSLESSHWMILITGALR